MTLELSSEQIREVMKHRMKPEVQKLVDTFAGKYVVSFIEMKGLVALLVTPTPPNETT